MNRRWGLSCADYLHSVGTCPLTAANEGLLFARSQRPEFLEEYDTAAEEGLNQDGEEHEQQD